MPSASFPGVRKCLFLFLFLFHLCSLIFSHEKKERKGYLETLSFRCRRHLKWEAFQKWEALETREEVGAEGTGRVPKAKELKGAPSATSTVSFPHCTHTMVALTEGEPCELTDYGIT